MPNAVIKSFAKKYGHTKEHVEKLWKSLKKEYGENYHDVYDREGHSFCQRCGGEYRNGKWTHQCKACKKIVNPGELTGLFVPHSCPECHKKQIESDIKNGNACRMCGKA